MTASIALILALLFGCFAIIFVLAMFVRVVSGHGRRLAMMLALALLVMAAIRFFDGPWPGGRSLRSNVASLRSHGEGEGTLRHALEIEHGASERRAEHANDAGIRMESRLDDAVLEAELVAKATRDAAIAFSLRHGVPFLERSTAPDVPTVPGVIGAFAATEPAPASTSVGSKVRSTARKAVRHSRDAVRRVRSEARRSTRDLRSWARGHSAKGVAGMLVMAFALAAFLFVGYLFLDAGTRGQFTWPLRLVSLVAFILFFASLARWSIF